MPQIQGTFDPNDPRSAPVVEVEISYPVSSLRPGEAPRSEKVPFVIDTGASGSFVSRATINQLRLDFKSLRLVRFGSQSQTVDVFAADFCFPQIGWSVSNLAIAEYLNPNSLFQGILGRDILNKGTLTYDGLTGAFILAFP
jgi:hypothetical protein